MFGNEYSQNITLSGFNLDRNDLIFQILSEKKEVIYESTHFQNQNSTRISLTVPKSEFQLQKNYLRLAVNDSHAMSGTVEVFVLESIDFLDVQPRVSFQGIDNN